MTPPPDLLDELLQHARGFLAAGRAEIQPRPRPARRWRFGIGRRNCSRTGRNPAAPSRPSCGARIGLPSASFMRSSIGIAGSCHGASSSSLPAQAPGAGRRRRRRAGVVERQQRPAKKPVQPGALLVVERRIFGDQTESSGGVIGCVHAAHLRRSSAATRPTSWRARERLEALVRRRAVRRDRPCSRRLDQRRRVLGRHIRDFSAPIAA